MGTSSSYMVAVAILFLTATVAYSATPPYKCFPFSGSGHATIEPTGDIVREVGQPYEAYCLFDPTHINVSEVGFFREGNDKIQIPHTIVNDSAIKAEVTHDTAMKYSLWCSVNSQHLCSREVKIGYPPQDVTSLSCLSKNWVNLNCSWTTPYNPVDVQYHLTYVIVGFKEQSECPTSQSNDNSCLWVNDNFNVRIRDNWIMHFNATNKFNEKGVVYKHNVSLFKSVLPNPVENLEAHVDGPNNVTLTWTLPHPMDVFESIRCEASYRKHDEGDVSENATWTVVSQWKVKPDQWNSKEVFNKTINNLNAYIQYDFRVRIHTGFGEVRPHMWSDAAISTQRTAAMRPTVAPRTTLGTFEIEENLKFRDIYVFWQRIDKLRQNGPNFRYEVDVYQISNGSQNYEKVPNGEIEPKESYFKFMNMKKNVAYRFEIVPVNSEGRPEADDVKAVVTVPEKTSVLKLPSFFRVTVYGGDANTNYALKWRIDSQSQEVETVTLYWCKKDKYEERCKNKLEWMVVTDPSKEKEDLVLDGESLYLFGISVNSRTSSSGIKWITCISKDGNQPPPLDQFKISSHSSREVNLEWSMDCKAKSAEPTGFVISYCDVPEGQQTDCPPDADMHYEHIMDEAVVSHKMQNLHPYANYIFNIAIQTDIGRSKWSKSVSVRTNPEKPSGPPQALEVKDYGQTWTLLSWKPPLAMERNGLVEKYKVSLEDTPSRLPDMMVHNTTPESTTYNVSGLDPFTKYTFKVIACTKIYDDYACGENSATVEHQTKIGAPSKIDDLYQNDGSLMWEHDCSNGPACFYEVKYYVNDTEYTNYTELNAASIDMRDLGITCSENENNLEMKLRAITRNESNNFLYGPWKEETVACPLPVIWWWIILLICAVCIVVIVIIIGVGSYGWDKIKEFLSDWKVKPSLPVTMLDVEPQKKAAYFWPPAPRHSISSEKTKTPSFLKDKPESLESEDLIPDGERGGRNPSGDSGTSVADPGDSSDCSTGGESDSSSASDHVPPSTDSGTVQEEPGFNVEGRSGSGSLRLRIPGTPYVRGGQPDGLGGVGYVSASSVPNLAVGMSDGSLSLQPFTPDMALSILPEMPLVTRTSTGYISMPDADADNISLDVLSKLALSHEGRQPGYPHYSRHNFPYKKTVPELSAYTKTGSLPWLNTGYVAVAQAEGGRQGTLPQARGYVAVSDAMGAMKRQPSLPSLSTGISKSISTPDEDLPPGAYCRVGSRSSPGPPIGSSPGYVGITQAIPLRTAPNSLTTTSPTNKSPYVTCAIAESLVSPPSTPEKGSGGYVSVGDLSGGRWAHPVIQPDTGEESREVASAPVEGSRGRPSISTRPSTSDATVNHNRGGTRWPPLAPCLSKQSSGYVSQETLTFHDPVVMSPKRLLAQSHEPHSVVLSANHKVSMV